MPRYNPFKPGAIIHTGMFAGRAEEIAVLEKALTQTAAGNPSHFLIHGERGIGKSSLLMLVDELAQGLVPIEGKTLSFLTVTIELEPSDTYRDIISKVARELHRAVESNERIKTLLKDIWTFVTNWKVMGVEYKREATPTDVMLEELADKVAAIAKKLDASSGIFIFIDEADKPPHEAGLGEFVKVFTERLSRRRAQNVGLGVSGISTVMQSMRKSHESSLRILRPIELRPLGLEDRKDVVRKGIAEANRKNDTKTTITDEALSMIANLSEGYPHFIQQYAYSAFDEDDDFQIDAEDVREALVKEGGALELLGQRFFENMYTDEIRSDDYRKVLQVAARHPNDHVSRKTIGAESGLRPHTVNNAIAALTKRGSLVAKKGGKGEYCLPSRSFAAWILAFKVARTAAEAAEETPSKQA